MMNDRLSGKYRRQWAGHIARDKPMQLSRLLRMTARSTFPYKPHMELNRAYLRIGSSIGCCAQVAEKRETRGKGLKSSANMPRYKHCNRRFRIRLLAMRTVLERLCRTPCTLGTQKTACGSITGRFKARKARQGKSRLELLRLALRGLMQALQTSEQRRVPYWIL